MVTLDRQEIISTNKSLRLIKNELEHLLEKGVVNDDIFDQINRLLPAESSISHRNTPVAAAVAAAAAPPTPVSAPQTPPVNAMMANLALNQNPNPTPAPPAYHQTGPPSLPARGGPPAAAAAAAAAPPPPPPPSKPVLAHARALYRYQAADDRDLSFERDDRVAVQEYMNDDWWMGRNERTGAEGIFPKNYVHIDQDYNKHQQPPPTPVAAIAAPYGGYGSPAPVGGAGGYPPPPPGGHNPYNANVPPMAVAHNGGGQPGQQQEGGGGNSKLNENGKKIGKKLGNAAIFGAGATIGSNLVNSIF